jgi:PiT family inorganic phosphate transporter
VGSIQRMKVVRWGIARNTAWAWLLTIPEAAIIAYASFWVLHLVMGA